MSEAKRSRIADATERYIDAARAVLKPTPVELHKIPRWLSVRLYQARQEGKIHVKPNMPSYCLLYAVAGPDSFDWLDHWGTTTVDGEVEFVSELYSLNLKAAKRFAKLLGLKWRYSANSWWYPGWTYRISFYPPQDEQRANEPTDRQLHDHRRRQCSICLRQSIPETGATYIAFHRLFACNGAVADRLFKDHSQSRRGKYRTTRQFLSVVRQWRVDNQSQPQPEDTSKWIDLPSRKNHSCY
jgi:hypothetical protein